MKTYALKCKCVVERKTERLVDMCPAHAMESAINHAVAVADRAARPEMPEKAVRS